jgi:DNA primase
MKRRKTTKVEYIKTHLGLIELIESYGIELKPVGMEFTTSCPFHNDKNPSFRVREKDGEWVFKCFGSCGKSGDVINFYQYMEGLTLKGAIEELCTKLGYYDKSRPITNNILDNSVGVRRYQERQKVKEMRKEQKKRKSYHYIFAALKNFCGELDDDVREYLCKRRGFDEKTLKDFKIFNIGNYRNAKRFLLQNFNSKELRESGIFEKNKDKFTLTRNRVIIPTIVGGEIVNLKGRYLHEGQDKVPEYLVKYGYTTYKNIQPIKGLFFNEDILKDMEEGSHLYLCEGELDAMSLQERGKKAISLLGVGNYTGSMLKRLAPFNIHVCFDNWDGKKPTELAIQKAERRVEEFIKTYERAVGKGDSISKEVFDKKYKDINDYFVATKNSGKES